MGIFRRKNTPDLGEHAIFGDEEAAALQAELASVVARIDELNERVSAQFTSISAHAEISREQMSEVREEARADMERSRDMLIGLIDRLRDEQRQDAGPVAAASRDSGHDSRFDGLQQAIADLAERVEQCEQRQRQMAETMTAFIDTMLGRPDDTMLDRSDDEPVRGLAIA